MKKSIKWFYPIIGKREQDNIKKVIKINYPNQGKFTKKFEKKISKIIKVKYAVAVPSGTVALFMALKALGVGKNDNVVVPNLTFVATANAVAMSGAKVVLVDIDKKNLGICLNSLKTIVKKKKIKAIIPVHISGRGSNIFEVIKFAKKNNITVIEDAAEAFFSKKKYFLGSIGDVGCFSFSPNKIITTGQGGAIVTNKKKIYLTLLKLRDQGRIGKVTGGGEDKIVAHGYNFKFTNILSSVGLAQIQELLKRKKKLIWIHKMYIKNIKKSKKIKFFEFNLKNGEFPLWTDVYSSCRDKLIKTLSNEGIECRKFWKPLNTLPIYKKSFKNFPNSKFFLNKLFWLPSNFEMNKKEIIKICNKINKYI